jgi:hypothetical protein
MYSAITSSGTLPLVQTKYPRAHRCRRRNSVRNRRQSCSSRWLRLATARQCGHSGDPAEEDGAALGRRRLPDHLVPERVVAIGDVVGEVVAALVVAVGVTETIAETSTGCAIVVDGR